MTWPTLNPPTGNSTLPTDTSFGSQWNLTSSTGGINVATAWQNYTGAGVKIGVIDDGIDYNHSDLAPNYLTALQYDAMTPDGSALGTSSDDHGTTVAGVLAAARNGSGIVGVAYSAGFAGIRIGYGSNGTSSQYADALNHLASNGFDVGNCSWGYSMPFQDNFSSYWASSKTAIQNDVQNGRHSLGIPIVFAAMNNRSAGDNVNYHNYQNDPYVITVASTDSNGHVSSYSNPGAAVLVSAPGNGVITDDRVGSAGWSGGDYVTVEGTSYSAPTVSGVIALMLQANPNLGFRDVEQILAYSATNTDPTNSSWQANGATNWNGGGMHFSQDYGFGMVNATAAVRLAESWDMQQTYANMTTESSSHTDNLAYLGGCTVQSKISFASALDVQKMVVDLNISDANVTGLTVSLTSPSGTTAVLASHPANGTGSGIVFEMSANTFWGENAAGTWTLTVNDSTAGDSGVLNGWTLTALGDPASTPSTYIYTNEFATASGTSRLVLNDSSGNVTINTAAVTGGCTLDLHSGAVDTIDGRSLTVGAATIVKYLWAGDGNDMIFCNDAGDTVQAGRGNDTIVAGRGADTLSGGPGSDTFDFNFLKSAPDTITDFSVGSDVVNLHALFASVGYAGSNPVADQWLSLTSDGKGGTDFGVNPHNGGASQTIADVLNIGPTSLHQGTDFLV
jgi:subtilisin family serine protease